MNFRECLIHIGSSFLNARKDVFAGHPLAAFIRNDAPRILEASLSLDSAEMKVEASPGKGQWSTAPWIRIADPTVSESALCGFYPVYLFSVDAKSVVLTLLQGTTSVREEFKRKTQDVLRSRAVILAAKAPEYAARFSNKQITLNLKSLQSRDQDREDWEAASAFAKTYALDVLPSNEDLIEDMQVMLDLYRKIILRGGMQAIGESEEETEDGADQDHSGIDGRLRLRRHKTLERNRRLAQKAKEIHGTVCVACGSCMEHIYGDAGKDYIEAHHLVPLSNVATEGGIRRDPKTDFTVLCPNCHRMIHRLGVPAIDEFVRRVQCRAVESCMRKKAHKLALAELETSNIHHDWRP